MKNLETLKKSIEKLGYQVDWGKSNCILLDTSKTTYLQVFDDLSFGFYKGTSCIASTELTDYQENNLSLKEYIFKSIEKDSPRVQDSMIFLLYLIINEHKALLHEVAEAYFQEYSNRKRRKLH